MDYPRLSSAMEPGIKVKSWAFNEDPGDSQRPVDDFFTIYLNYYGSTSTTGTLKLKRESSDWHFDIMNWFAELDVDMDAWDCTMNVVVKSCEILLRLVAQSARKSLEFKVEVFLKDEDHDHQEEVDYLLMYSDGIRTSSRDIKSILQDSGVRFDNGHSRTMNNCSICLEKFGMSNNVATLPCFHMYHEKCMIRWAFQGKRTCPLCRLKIKG
ncbi:E3 ubiquitin ligase BIG BROTHER-related-like [Chenopodium quinoa]|uniref:E3 ubiquitin ligase BIG BROTHER-related-like n=1 Tax=Chenopodium quinoa TaxID=63459 RepID=UPI000B77C5A6|nr:E3 ubiquitin ligase BIG BROTHER-related-like [Chenopodium quinoa]